jgi:hypothetical protein
MVWFGEKKECNPPAIPLIPISADAESFAALSALFRFA